jgi:Protein kinase domain
MTSEDIELYVMGEYDGDSAALERAIVDDDKLAELAADASRLELLLRDAGAAATFCAGCRELVTDTRCDACGAAVRPGGYVIERVLVANSHGRMYAARDADGKQVALKELAFVHAPSAEALTAFEREAKLLRALEHASIPRFVASFEEGEGVHLRYYLAQELVVGTALDRLDDHWYSEAEVIDIGKQVLASLVYLQSRSPMIVHRDIKPANLLRRTDNTIALVDFGAAHVEGTNAGSTTIGTFGYMPIEQLAGEIDATTDVYALGMTLVHLLTRQEPWRIAQSRATINASAPLRAFLDRMIAAAPSERFASARDALAALEHLGAPRAIALTRRRLVRPAIAAAIGVAIASSAVGVYELTRSRSTASVASPTTLLVRVDATDLAQIEIDGVRDATVSGPQTVSVAPGAHHIAVTLDTGARCSLDLVVRADALNVVDCTSGSGFRTDASGNPLGRRPVDAALADFKNGTSAAATRLRLRAIPSAHHDYPYALYWIAVLSLRDLNDWDGARSALAELAPMHIESGWLGPWTLAREAELAEHDGNATAARELWTKARANALATHYTNAEFEQFYAAAAKRYGLAP